MMLFYFLFFIGFLFTVSAISTLIEIKRPFIFYVKCEAIKKVIIEALKKLDGEK